MSLQTILNGITTGVNFINVLFEPFTPADPKSSIKIDILTAFIVLLRSALVKAARKMLMKLTPVGRWMNGNDPKKFAENMKESIGLVRYQFQ